MVGSNSNLSLPKAFRSLSIIYALLKESLNSSLPELQNEDDKYVILSSELIPIKSPNELYASLTSKSFSENFNSTAFCVKPTNQWEISLKDPFKRLVKHYPWLILDRVHAEIFMERFEKGINSFSLHTEGYKNLFTAATDSTSKAKKLNEYLTYFLLFGENDLNERATWNGLQPSLTVDQGICFAYVYANSTQEDSSELQHQLSPFKLNSSLVQGTDIVISGKNSVIQTLRFEVLVELRQSPHFLFVSKFHSESSTSYVTKSLPSDSSKSIKITIAEALESLHVIPAVNFSSVILEGGIDTLSAKNSSRGIGRHHSGRGGKIKFHRGAGDNTGLKVLMVTVDDRDLKPALEGKAEDYVSMVAALQSDYAALHGYDYISYRTDHALLIKLFREKFPDLDIKSKDFEENKYGYASFHAGYKYFRASSWSKLPPLWHLNKEYGSFYDYIWFVDSDATPNPFFRNRSLGDSFQIWKNSTEQSVYKGLKNPSEATLIFFSNFPWRDDLPCAGTFLIKTGLAADQILRDWWDYDIPQKNREDFMEQDAL